jgi:hypothetical protein
VTAQTLPLMPKIVTSWEGAPGNRRDWLGICKASDYEMRLMRDDTYLVLATKKFSVSAAP